MSTTPSVESDERTVAVANAGSALGFVVLYFGILLDGCYRTFVRHEAPLDLLALIIVSGAVSMLYRARQRAITHSQAKKLLLIGLIFGVLGAIMGAIMAWSRS